MLNIWDLWKREWTNAYDFYNSKGNVKTKSKLKDRWYKDFVKILKLVEQEVKATADNSDFKTASPKLKHS